MPLSKTKQLLKDLREYRLEQGFTWPKLAAQFDLIGRPVEPNTLLMACRRGSCGALTLRKIETFLRMIAA